MKKYIILLLALSQIVFGQMTLPDTVKYDTVKYDTVKYDTVKTVETTIITYQADVLIPVTYQNISAQEIKIKSLGQEPSFLLSETPSITNYSDAGSGQGYSYFRLRGIDQTRINITLDGVPLNEPEDQGAYFSNYPDILNSTNGIQIQRGIGVTKNGTASFGGGVQLTAPNLYDSTCTIGLSYGSFNSLRAFGEFSTGVRNNKVLYVRMSDINSSGYKYNSSNNSQSVYIHSGLFHKKSVSKLTLLYGQQQNELAWIGVADSLIQIDRRTNANTNETDQFVQSLAQIQNIWTPTASSTIHSSIYYTYLKGNYDVFAFNYALQSHLVGFFSNYTLRYKHLDWTTGIHGNTYRRQHIGSEATAGPAVLEAGRDIIADSKAFEFSDLEKVVDEHYKRIANIDSSLIIIDTDIHITKSYAEFVFNKELKINSVNDGNTIYLYLNNDVPFVQDGTRLNETERNALDISHRNVLSRHNINFIEISGDWETRRFSAINEIEKSIKKSIENLKPENFEKKYIIIGEILFSDNGAEIINIIKEEIVYSRKRLNEVLDSTVSNSYDYIILPDYIFSITSKTPYVLSRLNIIKKMAYDIGWIDVYRMIF